MNVVQLIFKNNSQKPNATVLRFKEENNWKEYSWSKLQDLVAQTANALKELNVRSKENVAIFAENMPQWIIMDLAVMSMGAVTVPIYATNTADQAKYIIDEAEVRVALAGNQKQYDSLLEICESDKESPLQHIIAAKDNTKLKNQNSRSFNDFIKNKSTEIEFADLDDSELATIIYTSGTTGEPKGAMLTHGNMINVFDSHIKYYDFNLKTQKENSLAFLPLTHVFERAWSLLILYCGWEISISENPKEISQIIKEVKPTMMCSVPRFYQKVYIAVNEKIEKASPFSQKIFNWGISVGKKVANLKRIEKSIPAFLALKYKIADKLVFNKIKEQLGGNLWFAPVGGAAITPNVSEFFDAIGLPLRVGYGLTETTATVTCFPFTNYKHGTSGKTMYGVEIKIGENKEILVKGNGVFKGYYKKEDETREAFTEDNWFKTGDAGEIDQEGNLTILDRIKDLMKTSNGKYITPQPIENILTNDSFIQQAVIIGDDRPYVTALLVPNFETLNPYAEEKLNVETSSSEELVSIQAIKKFYAERLEKIQAELSPFERVVKFQLLPREFEMDSGEITPTLKVRRKVVLEKYRNLIDEMYGRRAKRI